MKTSAQYRLLCSLAMMMAMLNAEAQMAQEVPRLVVSVVIDQLRNDYLEAFSPLYGEEGFHRLARDGRVYRRAEYPFAQPDRASAVACLASGATPYENGIVGERWLNRQTLQPQYCVSNGTPEDLAVSTLSDELKVATEGKALVYAVSPQSDAAVLSAGHAADGAYWLDDATGRWTTSDYYGLPSWLTFYNKSEHAATRIDNLVWEPINDLVGQFNYFVGGGMKRPFRHNFRNERRWREFKASGLVNEEVTDFVVHLLQNTLMGVDAVTDYLAVNYYAGNYDHRTVAQCPMELQDTYVRLDDQLARLIRKVEEKVGRNRVLFVITSTGHSDAERLEEDLTRYRIPTGEFNITRAQGLLNMYLSAVYGQGQYVEASMGSQLYLNLKFAENKGINLSEMLERSADFLIQLSGVRDVYTSARLSQGAWTPGIRLLRNAYNPRLSGDILIQVASGWRLVNEQTNERVQQRDSYMAFPLYLYGAGIVPKVVEEPIDVDRVAPTLARCLRIRAPNACTVAPLTGVR